MLDNQDIIQDRSDSHQGKRDQELSHHSEDEVKDSALAKAPKRAKTHNKEPKIYFFIRINIKNKKVIKKLTTIQQFFNSHQPFFYQITLKELTHHYIFKQHTLNVDLLLMNPRTLNMI